MKLELTIKHIAPYLPYGLELIYRQIGDSSTIKMTVRDIETVIMMVNRNVENKAMFPILRPISDLTKEIEVNGEKFVPYKKLDWGYCNGDAEFGNVVYCAYGESPKTAINVLDYINDYFQLLQWHFDVFGLIEQGLAIDINNLND